MTRRSLQEWLDITDELYGLGAFGKEKDTRARRRRDRFKRRIVAATYRLVRSRARRGGSGRGTIGGEVGPREGSTPVESPTPGVGP